MAAVAKLPAVAASAKIGDRHPECRPSELFLGYSDEAEYRQIRLSSKRKGHSLAEAPNVFPVFVDLEEHRRVVGQFYCPRARRNLYRKR